MNRRSTGHGDAVELLDIRNVSYAGRIEIDRARPHFESRAVASPDGSPGMNRPDTIIDGWSTTHYCFRGASVRGDGHRLGGSSRQDELMTAYDPKTGALLLVVADGVSAASSSHLGATAVCRYAIHEFPKLTAGDTPPDWETFVHGAAWTLVELAKKRCHESNDDRAYSLARSEFATTLAVAILKPISSARSRLSAFAIGDSSIWILNQAGLTNLIGAKSQDLSRPVTSSVLALPLLPKNLATFDGYLAGDDVLLAMSDGIGDALGDGTGLLGDLLRAQLIIPPPQIQMARVADFARESFGDDRTLAGVWHVGAVNPGELVDQQSIN